MKKQIAIVLALALLLIGCAEHKTINGVTYLPYGLLNQEENKNPAITYEVPIENLIVGALLCETIIIPIYIVGWDLYEPVAVKPPVKGQEPVAK